MTRSKRIQPIKTLADDKERDAGHLLASAQRILDEQERQRAQLVAYRDDYQSRLARPGQLDAVRLQNYQAFLSRLEDALRQQEGLVTAARAEVERCRDAWRERRIEAASLSKAVDRMQLEERHARDRREQAEQDEHAARRGRAPRE
jgi:flagellar protein FliJ